MSKHVLVAHGASMNGFILEYRKILFVDGAYSSGPYERTILVAVALDADDHLFDITYCSCVSREQ